MGAHAAQYCCSLILRLADRRSWISYHWTPKKKPYLEKGKVKVTCHPSNSILFIYPSASSDDRDKWENAGKQEEEDEIKEETKTSPPLAPREGELDEDDVPTIRSRP